jgi:hypothetical protein
MLHFILIILRILIPYQFNKPSKRNGKKIMAVNTVFRFMDLPPELRYRTYDFLDFVYSEPVSIYEISILREAIHNAPKVMQEEMLNVYIGKNRFTVSYLMGLPQLLSTDAKPYISRLRFLRLAAHGTWKQGPPRSIHDHHQPRCEVDVNLVRREPWFTTNLTHAAARDQSSSDKVLTSLEAKLDAILSKSKDSFRTFDTNSLCDLVEHWLSCRR